MSRIKEKKEMEYEDAPSGYVTLYNYKEPFMKYDKGFGYLGVLLFDGATDQIQCHLCGQWFKALPQHVSKEHNMMAAAYKQEVGLLQSTALISESTRAALIASGHKRFKNLRKGTKHTKEQIEKIRNTLIENGKKFENMNLRGTCPEQLLDRLQKLYKEKGEDFSSRDIGFSEALEKVYGSVREACTLAGIPYRKSGENKSYSHRIKYTREDALAFFKEHLLRFERIPTSKDFKHQNKSGLYEAARIHDWNKKNSLVDDALAGMQRYRKIKGYRYSKQQLIKFLQDFEKNNGRKPATSDCKRNLLPHASRYSYNFGSWKNALKEANLC